MGGVSEVWERQKGEPELWFERFRVYLRLGAERSLTEAYRRVLDKGEVHDVSRTWKRRAKEWAWSARAEAWDRARTDDAEARRQEVLREQFDRRLEWEAGQLGSRQQAVTLLQHQAMSTLALAVKALPSVQEIQAADPETLAERAGAIALVRDAAKAAETYLRESRAECNALPTQPIAAEVGPTAEEPKPDPIRDLPPERKRAVALKMLRAIEAAGGDDAGRCVEQAATGP